MPVTRTNSEGKTEVAIAYWQPQDTFVSVNGHGYHFTTYYSSIAWVLEEDAKAIVSIQRSCCGGRVKQAFNYANENQVAAWNLQFK